MLTITNTRIVGLIAVVCAAVVAPQALAATNTHSTVPPPGDPTHNTVSPPGDPSDVIQRYQLRGELSDQGLAPTAFAAVPSQSPMGQPANNTPGGFDLGDLKIGGLRSRQSRTRASRRVPRPPRSRLFSVEALT